MQLTSKGGNKVFIFHLGHITKIATMPIYGENFEKSSPPEKITGPIALKHSMWHLGKNSLKVYIDVDPVFTLNYLMQGQIWFLRLLNGKS